MENIMQDRQSHPKPFPSLNKKDSLAFYTSTCMGIKMKAIQNKGQNPNGSWKMLLESAFP